MKELTINQFLLAFSQACDKLEKIERILEEKKEKSPEPDKWLNVTDLCAYLPNKPARQTVYGWVRRREIPFHKGHRKGLRFLKSEIDGWLMLGRNKTALELAKDADQYLNAKKGVNHGK